jgi:hypothetical protein
MYYSNATRAADSTVAPRTAVIRQGPSKRKFADSSNSSAAFSLMRCLTLHVLYSTATPAAASSVATHTSVRQRPSNGKFTDSSNSTASDFSDAPSHALRIIHVTAGGSKRKTSPCDHADFVHFKREDTPSYFHPKYLAERPGIPRKCHKCSVEFGPDKYKVGKKHPVFECPNARDVERACGFALCDPCYAIITADQTSTTNNTGNDEGNAGRAMGTRRRLRGHQ